MSDGIHTVHAPKQSSMACRQPQVLTLAAGWGRMIPPRFTLPLCMGLLEAHRHGHPGLRVSSCGDATPRMCPDSEKGTLVP